MVGESRVGGHAAPEGTRAELHGRNCRTGVGGGSRHNGDTHPRTQAAAGSSGTLGVNVDSTFNDRRTSVICGSGYVVHAVDSTGSTSCPGRSTPEQLSTRHHPASNGDTITPQQ
ncbi:hypothetical protein GDO86_019360 [Hymenochirus boettgeri]|uniref:Uncharacterized protein n=1 Tax=Hymenochirus boettgeri TaxID=247094 RepID=A0A8T2IHJ6_9PIPI|nr:hypothetical protein GDO86_019360 [Hymenochirus boettgeri]